MFGQSAQSFRSKGARATWQCSSDVVALKVEDVAPSGYAVDRATVRQRKTSRPVRFELTEQTRQALDDYIKWPAERPVNFYFLAGVVQGKA